MKKAFFIINAAAGKNRLRGHFMDIFEQFCQKGYIAEVAVTLRYMHAEELAFEAAEQGKDMIVCCGGDGTLNEVVSGVMRSGKPIEIGYIPSGSTNDFAQSAKIPFEVSEAVENILSGECQNMDVGSFNGRNFIYIASFGAFTAVSYKTPKSMKNTFGHLAYWFEGVKDLGSIASHHLKITTDDQVVEDDFSFGAIGNSRSIGGIVHMSDDVVCMNDGLFELLLIRMPKNPVQLASIVIGLSQSDFSGDMFLFLQGDKFTIESDGSFDWTLDGERAEGASKIEIKNIHNAYQLRTKVKEAQVPLLE